MFGQIFSAAADEAASLRTMLVRLIAGIVVGAAAAVAVLIGLWRALFVWVDWHYGPLAGHLAVAGAAFVVAILAFSVAMMRRRRHRRITTAAYDARVHAFDSARSFGERVSDTVTGRAGPLHSKRGLTNAVLGALVMGMLLGRRF